MLNPIPQARLSNPLPQQLQHPLLTSQLPLTNFLPLSKFARHPDTYLLITLLTFPATRV